MERMVWTPVHPDGNDIGVVSDADRLCFVRVCAAIGAGAAGFPASVDRSMLPFAMLEQLLPHRAGYTSVRMADEATDHALPLHTHGDGRPPKAFGQRACVQALADVFGFVLWALHRFQQG